MKHVLMVEKMAEESVKKRSDFRLGVEGWSTDLESEAELCDDTPPPSNEKCLSLSLSQRPGICALQNVTNCFAQPVEASAL